MSAHSCGPFLMRSDSYVLEVDGDCWVLHVFDVQGEEDLLAVQLRLGSREEYESFPGDFEAAVMERSGAHPAASGCPDCRPRDRGIWVSLFTAWIRDAYSVMPRPPRPVEAEEVPEVVRLSMECVYNQGCMPEASSVN